MTESEKQLIFDLRAKIKKCISLYEILKVEKLNIENKNEGLLQEIAQLKAALGENEQKYQTLKMAKYLLETENDPQEAKQKVTKIVREIDKCIALLNR
ncbi:MAG: hypothetical protein Q8859_02890 [Bacteroidota bacterium]|nr:hypothetical protein [Bacteroidota bacterium]